LSNSAHHDCHVSLKTLHGVCFLSCERIVGYI